MKVEVRHKLRISQIPTPTGIVGHDVGRARDEVVKRNIAEVALM